MGKYEGIGTGWSPGRPVIPKMNPGPDIQIGDRVQLRTSFFDIAAGTQGSVVRRCGLGKVVIRFDGDSREMKVDKRYVTFLKHLEGKKGWKETRDVL